MSEDQTWTAKEVLAMQAIWHKESIRLATEALEKRLNELGGISERLAALETFVGVMKWVNSLLMVALSIVVPTTAIIISVWRHP